jgi:thymidylate synthase
MAASIDRWQTCGEAWVALLRHVWRFGEAAIDDRGAIIEAPPTLFEIASLGWQDPIIGEYGDAEAAGRYTAKFTRLDVVAPFKYSYGARLRELQGVDQIQWVIGLLRARPWTKSGWISLTVPGECGDAVPCLSALSFRIRSYRVAMTATFRSQNAYTCYLNYIPLRTIQLEVADGLGLPAGSMRVFVDVPHIYVADTAEVAKVLAAVPESTAA